MFTKINDLIEYLSSSSESIALTLAFAITCLLIANYFKSQLDGFRFAQWLVYRGQFELAPTEHVERAINMAEGLGKKDLAIRTFAAIRQKYGHSGLRVGHVMWVVMLVNGDIQPTLEIPSFEPPAK